MLTHRNASPRAPGRVVILGEHGFVPKALRKHAEKAGFGVLALGSDSVDLTDPGSAKVLEGRLEPTDALVMTAALTPEKGRDTGTLIRNLRMAENLLAALAARPCAHLVYFSSDSVYGWAEPVLSEATQPSPDNLYGAMHLAREIALREGAKKAAIPFCVLRPCAIYGPGDTHDAYGPNRFVRTAAAEGRIELFGEGDDTRDHVAIDDVVRLTRMVIERQSEGLLNVVSGSAVTFAHVASEIVRMMGRPISIAHVKRSGPPTSRAFDASAMSGAFPGHRPTPLATGLRSMIDGSQAA